MKTGNIGLQNELKEVLQQQIELTDNKEQKIKLLTKLQEITENLQKENPDNTSIQKRIIDSIYERLRVMKKPDNKLLNELKDRIGRLEANKIELKGVALDSSMANFHMLLHVCPLNEDNYGHMIKLLEVLNKKKCPEHVAVTLIKGLQLHFLEIKIKNQEKYYQCLSMLFNIINKYLKKKSNRTADFVKFTLEYVAKRNNIQFQTKDWQALKF